jgi:hypothetical protein
LDDQDKLSITVLGILKLAEFKKNPLENYSLFSEENLKIESKKVNDFLVARNLQPNQYTICEKFNDKYGPKTIRQIIDYLQTIRGN